MYFYLQGGLNMMKHSINLYVGILCILFLQQSYAQLDSLTNIGHASMKIKTADGKIIYIDPYASGDYSDSADILLVTHAHPDHNNQSLVKLKAGGTKFTYVEANINGALQSTTVGNIKIDAVPAYNTSNNNHLKNQCVGYVIEFNGIKLYHAGDTENIPEMADLAARELDYALLPMEGVFTMTPAKATLAAQAIKAKQFIPMHTMTSQNDTVNDNAIAQFNVPNKITLKKGKTIALVSNPTSAKNNIVTPAAFTLAQNYPNPFNPTTTFSFSLPAIEFATLKVYNLLGVEVATVVAKKLAAGNYTIEWNAGNLSSGIYLYRLTSGSNLETKKLLLLK